jgi:glucose-6-phosphate-specific signal transduction histidine kinase
MDQWRIEPVRDRGVGLPAEVARFGVAGLSLRLSSLRQKLERDFPLSLALDITDREAVDGLAPDLTAAIHALLQAAALDAARHAGASLVRLAVHVSDNSVMLRVEDDGGGAAFKGNYDLSELLAYGVGPQALAQLVAARGGRLRLDCRASGSRIEIVLPRDGAMSGETIRTPALAAAS